MQLFPEKTMSIHFIFQTMASSTLHQRLQILLFGKVASTNNARKLLTSLLSGYYFRWYRRKPSNPLTAELRGLQLKLMYEGESSDSLYKWKANTEQTSGSSNRNEAESSRTGIETFKDAIRAQHFVTLIIQLFSDLVAFAFDVCGDTKPSD